MANPRGVVPQLNLAGRLLAGLAVCGFFSAVVWVGIGGDLRMLSKLRAHGRPTSGVVKELQLEGPRFIAVEFEVDGVRHFVRSALVGKPNARLEQLRIGQLVQVWYLPADPQMAAVGNPQALLLRDRSIAISFSIGTLVFFCAVWAWFMLEQPAPW